MNRRRFLGLMALGVFGLARGKLPDIPPAEALPTAPVLAFQEGTFLYIDGGTLELGIVRDSVLTATDDFQIFGETYEAVTRDDRRFRQWVVSTSRR